MDVQPADNWFNLKTYDIMAYIKIIIEITIEIIPIIPTNFNGFDEKLIIPSDASYNIFFNGYFVFPA